MPAAPQVQPVDLVDNSLDGHLPGPDPGQNRLDRRDLVRKHIVGQRAVHDVQDEIRDERLLERRGEALDELRRQTADEADRVGDQVALPVVGEPSRRGDPRR
jgi:hypothetical protein